MRRTASLGLVIAAAVPAGALARSIISDRGPPPFLVAGHPIGGMAPAGETPAHLTGSRIAALSDGALVIDADSGSLIQTDAAGAKVAALPIGPDAGLMVHDATARRAYVANRHGDELVVVETGAQPKVAARWKTPVEPYGVALAPDRKTLLVATIADRALVAYDTSTGVERWRVALGREPRGLAISPDGTRALVSYLGAGAVDEIELASRRTDHVALPVTVKCRSCGGGAQSFARAAFAVTFLGENQAVVPYQRETPVQRERGIELVGTYGGGVDSPITHHVAFLGRGGAARDSFSAQISEHQPRAIAWDAARDALYIAGLGNDSLFQIRNASQASIREGLHVSLSAGPERCGPDGVAIAPDGNVLVWCSFSRSVQRIAVAKGPELTSTASIRQGSSLVASRLTAQQHLGMMLFHRATHETSQRASMACSSCHPDHRTDGLSWRIDRHELQTPILAGRIRGTHPFKWDGGDPDLNQSLTSTMKRLGGQGLNPAATASLAAYIEMLPPVRTPTRDTAAVARGKRLFDSAELGCRTCHGGVTYTDRRQHKLAGSLPQSDTPSLLGLAASAPYFHDGSAETLEALLLGRSEVHGMAETSKLSQTQVADLTAFLETL